MGFWDSFNAAVNGNGGGGGDYSGGGDQGQSYYNGGGGNQGGYGGNQGWQVPWQMQQGGQSPYNWQNFMDQYNQIQQVNQGWQQNLQQQQQMREQQNNTFSRDEDKPRYRQMNDLEKFVADARQASDFVNNVVGNALFGTPDNPQTGEQGQQGIFGKPDANADLGAISVENAPRMVANLPGMILGSVPDLAAYGGELIANAPAQDADLSTGLIEDRTLTDEERYGDIGYGALSALGFVPGAGGLVSKAGGVAAKGVGALAKKAGASAAGDALKTAGRVMGTGSKQSEGFLEKAAMAAGKEGTELNKYRWGDVAIGGAHSAVFEGAQEAGQTLFEDMRNHQFDMDDPNETKKRMAEGAFWGGVLGGGFGTVEAMPKTISANKFAKAQLAPQAQPHSSSTNYFDFRNKEFDQTEARITPEMHQYLLEQEGNQDNLEKVGSNLKGIAGSYGQNPNSAEIGTVAIKRQFQRNADDSAAVSEMASNFDMDEDTFRMLMRADDQKIADTLDPIVRRKYRESPRNRFVYSNTRAPSTKPGSHQTYFASGVRVGNTVAFAPGNPTIFGGDLDGDTYSMFVDKGLSSWEHLPTRKLRAPKNMPAKGSDGLDYTGYGSSEYGWTESGITPALGDSRINGAAITTVHQVLYAHGIRDNAERSKIWGQIRNAFKTTTAEDKAGITWEMKLSSVLSDIVDDFNGRIHKFKNGDEGTIALMGDDLVSDIIAALAREGSVLAKAEESVEAYNLNNPDNYSPELRSTSENIPTTRGSMPKGKVNLMQILSWFGKLNYELTTKDSPMFRFKQMVAWNAKFVEMSNNLLHELGLNATNRNEVTEHIKWCMQMINDMHLPIDYIDTAYKVKCISEISSELGLNSSTSSNKFGSGLEYSHLREVVTRIVNENSKLFQEAVEGTYTTRGEESIRFSFQKDDIKESERGSFARKFLDLFGSWDVLQLANIDSTSQVVDMNLGGLVEMIAESPTNIDTTAFAYVDGGFNELLNDLVNDYEGKESAALSNAKAYLSACTEMKADISVDKDSGIVSWSPEHNLEVGFWTSVIQNILGMRMSAYLGVLGTEHLRKSGWGKYVINKNQDTVYRGLLAMGVRYNWREYIDALENPKATELHRQKALQRIDFENPLNLWILTRMYAAGKKKTGLDGVLDDAPLREITDPSKGTFAQFTEAFDDNPGPKRVRRDQDMILYYALDDGTSVITGSDLVTRARSAKNYISAMKNNAMSKAVSYVEDVKSLTNAYHHINEQDIVTAIYHLATDAPNQIPTDTYAVAIHDAGFGSGKAAEKAKASNGASMHWDSVTNYLGGYSASFLKQLGVSVGNIDSETSYNIADAIRQAIFDPKYEQSITLDNRGNMITISQDIIFKQVNPAFNGDNGVSYSDIIKLFEAAPQLLCQIMPHTYEPLSPDTQTVSAVMVGNPADMIVDYINGDSSTKIKMQQQKVRNKILSDQDSTLLVFGTIDPMYDSIVSDTRKWTDEVTKTADEWAEFLYNVSLIEDPVLRRQVIEREFGTTGEVIGRRTKSALEDVMNIVRQRESAQMSAGRAKSHADKVRTLAFLKEVDAFIGDESSVKKDYLEDKKGQSSKDRLSGIAKEEALERKAQHEISIALTEAYLQYEVGSKIKITDGVIDQTSIDMARSEMEQALDENGNRKWTDDEIDKYLSDLQRKTDAMPLRKVAGSIIISRGDTSIHDPHNADEFIRKISNFYNGRDYKRLQSEYFKDERAFNDWKKEVKRAFNWKESGKDSKGNPVDRWGWTLERRRQWINNQAQFWNREILSASLQKTYDTYGVGTASNELAMLDEAKDFVYSMVDEIVCDNSIEKIGNIDVDTLSMPHLSYSNKATCPHITAASIELESGGAPIMSGQNAGSYQYLAVLDFIEKDFECPVDTRVGLTRDEAIALAQEQGSDLNYIDKTGVTLSVSEHELTYAWTPEQIAETEFAPQKDCLCGVACSKHNPLPIGATSGTYIGGRYTIADLCWYLSERKVFKSKKKRRVFDKISHIVNEAEDLKKTSFTFTDRETLLADVQVYQEKLAAHINKVFIDEHMDDEFGIDDARIVAQFMTPCLEVTYSGEDGIRRDTISKWSLANDDLFNNELAPQNMPELNIDASTIQSVRPVAMSITDVCKKVTSDVLDSLDSDENYQSGKAPKREKLSSYVQSGFATWRGKVVSNDKVIDFLKNTPVVRKASGRSIMFGSSPNAMQNFMAIGGSEQNAYGYSTNARIDRAVTNDPADRKVVKDVNKWLKVKTVGFDGNRPIIIVDHAGGRGLSSVMPYKSDTEDSLLRDLRSIDSDFSVPNAYNAILSPDIVDLDSDETVMSLWEEAKNKDRVLLVPVSSNTVFEKKLTSSGVRDVSRFMMNGTATVNGVDYYIYNQQSFNVGIENDYPQTYIQEFDPRQLFLGYEDRGMLATGDSGSKLTPEAAKQKMNFDSDMEFNLDTLIGNKPVLKGSRFNVINLDDVIDGDSGLTHRDFLKEEINSRLNGENDVEDSPFRLILPKFDDTYKVADSVVLESVNRYLNVKDGNLMPDGTVAGEVNNTDCMNIVAVRYAGDIYYIPLIYNRGGGPQKLDSVYLNQNELRSGKISMRWIGKISHTEGEGLKHIYPTIAYKTYGTVMNDEDLKNMTHSGIKISVVVDGQSVPFETSEQYSGSTEDSRLIDAGFQTKLENLANLGKILPRHYFMIKDPQTGEYVIDYERFSGKNGVNVSPQQITKMCEWNNKGAWWDFVNDPTMTINPDPEVNQIYRKVARASLSCGLNPLYVFANIYNNGKIRYIDYNHNLVFGVLTDNELERFFYSMDPHMCFDGSNEMNPKQGRPTPYIDRSGRILAADGRYYKGHIHFVHPTDDSSMLGAPSGQVKYGIQQVLNESLIEGVRKTKGGNAELLTLIEYARVKQDDASNYVYGGKYADSWFKEKSDEELRSLPDRDLYHDLAIDKYLHRTRGTTKQSVARRRKLMREMRKNISRRIDFTANDGNGKADLSSMSDEGIEYRQATNRFREMFKPDTGLTSVELQDYEIEQLFKETTASTWNEGRGNYKVTVRNFAKWCNDVCDRLQNGDFPFETGHSVQGRPVLPIVSSGLLDRLMTIPAFTNFDGHQWTRDEMVDMMFKKLDETLEYLNFGTVQQREAVYVMIDTIGGTYGNYELSRPLGDYGLHLGDLLTNSDPIYDSVSQVSGFSNLNERKKQTAERIKRVQDSEKRKNTNRVKTNSSETGFIARIKNRPKSASWNTLSAVSRMLSCMTPELMPSAVIGRLITQGQNRVYIWLDNNLTRGVVTGNTDGIVVKNRSAVKALAEDPGVQEMWKALNVLTWSGEDITKIQNVNSWEDFQNILDERMRSMTWAEKQQAKVFEWSSGGKHIMSWQIENWVDRLACRMTPDIAPELNETIDSEGTTRFEQMLIESPQNFMLDFMSMRDNNPYFIEANQARDWVVRREHAGRSMFGLALTHAFDNHPIGRFMFITGLCRFPHYAYETGGWFLNHFAPVSSFVYLVRSALIMKSQGEGKFADYLKELGIDTVQDFTSYREALVNDALMMGSTALACMLFGAMLYEPPDDEYYDELAGDPAEWTVAGMRIKENWWLMDILGPFGAVCATWESIRRGKPRLDILSNWMTQALWSNPMVKVGDLVSTMLDPTEQFYDSYDAIRKQYDGAEGGAPNMQDMFFSDSLTYGLNWFGQFITPGFIKEISKSREFMGYERSYKKVEDENGELVETDYLDSRIRKATRNNLVLGLLMDGLSAVTGNKTRTGYVSREMPEVRVPDENQKDTMNYFSLYNDDDSEKTEAEKQVIAFEILTTLQSNNDLDALWKNGFVIPMETRIYVSQVLNDMKQYETDEYNLWVQATGMDAYVVGNGSFTDGMKKISEIKAAYKDDLRGIDNLYDKLWSDEMNRGIQMYYRLPTTYARTRSGEWYATGYSTSINPLQFFNVGTTAPGTYQSPIFGTNPDGTMGRGGNWETPSVVVEGASAGGRALVPIDPEKITKPKLSDFASDKNNGYSDTKAGKQMSTASWDKQFNNPYGSSGSGNRTAGYPSGSRRSYGGGGGGGGRRGGGGYGGGGGGRSYTPNIYSPNVNLPKSSLSKIMNTDRIYGPDEQYLRPDFETKGSREAYRRSDI